jgi:hypothetical protein
LERLEDRRAPSVDLGIHFTGLTSTHSDCNCTPPDPNAAAGPLNVVELVNTALEITDRSGKILSGPTGLQTFFSGHGFSVNQMSDSVVLFDESVVNATGPNGRFVIVTLDYTSGNAINYLDFAISTDADATHGFTNFQQVNVGETSFFADWPRMGVNADAYFVDFNMFAINTGMYDHPQVLTIQKASVLSGGFTTFHHDLSNVLVSVIPAVMHGAASKGPEYFVTEGTAAGHIRVIKETNVLSDHPNEGTTSIVVPSYSVPPPAPEPNGYTSTANRSDILDVAWRNNVLVATHTVGTGSSLTAHARWYQFDTSAAPTLTQVGEINPGPGIATYFPSIDIDTAGDLGMTYMESSSSEFVSMYVTGRMPSDPPGTMEPGTVSSAGTDSASLGRAGDYSSTFVDPLTGTSFWSANEFFSRVSGVSWSTGVAHFSLGGNPEPIVADAGGPYTINEGDSLTLNGAGSSDPDGDSLSYSWDINGDGVYFDATGVNPTVSWADLMALGGIHDGSATYNVRLQVEDGNGNVSYSPATTLTVHGVPPTVSIAGPPYSWVTYQYNFITVTTTDPGSVYFTLTIDWGDGTSDTLVASNTTVQGHVYTLTGNYTISVTARDDGGDTNAPATLPISVLDLAVQGSDLAVAGTPRNDHFTYSPGSQRGDVVVHRNGTLLGTFHPTGSIKTYAWGGTDTVIINGGSGPDVFSYASGPLTLNGVSYTGEGVEQWQVNGWGGTDTLIGPTGGNNTWVLTGAGAGTLGGLSFRNIENLTGGPWNDTFQFKAGASLAGTIDGGTGGNTFDYTQYGVAATVDLQTLSASDVSHFASIQTFTGSQATDTLIGPNQATTWIINSNNAGQLGNIVFVSFENLVGGSADDTFQFANGYGVAGSIDGGGGVNTLDYSAYGTAVAVTLADSGFGMATNITGGIANIQNVTGGVGNDTLTGNSADNVLIGNAGKDLLNGGSAGNDILVGGSGNDTLAGGSGRSLLLGGPGADQLSGGGDDDLLISGTTSYDTNTTALLAILSEWKRTDEDYATRISNLRNGTGANGSTVLTSSTVRNDTVVDSLTGGAGQEWFWATLSQDVLSDRTADEIVN